MVTAMFDKEGPADVAELVGPIAAFGWLASSVIAGEST